MVKKSQECEECDCRRDMGECVDSTYYSKHTEPFPLRLTKYERDMLEEIAEKDEVKMSVVLRTALVKYYNQKFNNATIITLHRKPTDIKNIDTGLFESGRLDKDKIYDIVINTPTQEGGKKE